MCGKGYQVNLSTTEDGGVGDSGEMSIDSGMNVCSINLSLKTPATIDYD